MKCILNNNFLVETLLRSKSVIRPAIDIGQEYLDHCKTGVEYFILSMCILHETEKKMNKIKQKNKNKLIQLDDQFDGHIFWPNRRFLNAQSSRFSRIGKKNLF